MIKERLDLYRCILIEKRKFTLQNIERLKAISQIDEKDEKYTDHR